MWPFKKKEEVVTTHSMTKEDIARHNQTFRTAVPLGSSWKPRNIVPGTVNMVSMVIEEYSKEGYEVTAVYSDDSIKPMTIPYEIMQDVYVRDYRRELEKAANA